MASKSLLVTPSVDRAAHAAFVGLAAGLALGLGVHLLGAGPTWVAVWSVGGAMAVGLGLLRWRLSNVVSPHGVQIGRRWIPADTIRTVEIRQTSRMVAGSFRTGMRPARLPGVVVEIRTDERVFVLLGPRQHGLLAHRIGKRAASLLGVPLSEGQAEPSGHV